MIAGMPLPPPTPSRLPLALFSHLKEYRYDVLGLRKFKMANASMGLPQWPTARVCPTKAWVLLRDINRRAFRLQEQEEGAVAEL